MRRTWGILTITLLAVAGAAACSDDDGNVKPVATSPTSPTTAASGGTGAATATTAPGTPDPCTVVAGGAVQEADVEADLEGRLEVPGPGAANSDGSFDGTLDLARGAIRYEIDVEGTDAPTAAHIHEGGVGVAGPPVVTLQAPPANGKTEGCVAADPALLQRIAANPAGFYVNIHTAQFPNGAVRGQLET